MITCSTRLHSHYVFIGLNVLSSVLLDVRAFSLPDPKVDFLPNQTLPSYALEFAPYVYLHSQEIFYPADIKSFLTNVAPEVNFTVIPQFSSVMGSSSATYLQADKLQQGPDQSKVYLTAQSDIFKDPKDPWLYGVGPPDSSGKSKAAAIIIAMDKSQQVGPGWVDVFYLFFYAYNQGNYFYNNRFGDHVGDWEHTMIRFRDGKPVYIAPEAHGGEVVLGNGAFNFDVLEKKDNRPIVYSANGTHGMYPEAGIQNYTGLPIPIYDVTDKGYLWDLTQNYQAYYYSNEAGFSYTGDTPQSAQDPNGLGWLEFLGYWGDQKYPLSNPHQTCIGSECFYDDGPLGPQSKSLSRGYICSSSDCKPQEHLPSILHALSTPSNSAHSAASHLPTGSNTMLTLFSSIFLILLINHAGF